MSQATPTQRAVIDSRGRELAVAAGAGSGKTSTLIKRIIGLVTGSVGEAAPDPGQALELTSLLIVTFTRAAAAELRERVDSALAAALVQQEQTLHDSAPMERGRSRGMLRHLRRQRTLLPLAQISTIHSFCQRVINQYGAAQGLSAERVLTDEDAAQLKHLLATRFLDQQLGCADDQRLRGLALAWGGRDGVGPSAIASGARDTGLRALLLKLHGFQQGLRDPRAWWTAQMAAPELDPEHFDPAHPVVAGLLAEFTQWRDEALAASQRERELIAGWLPETPYVGYIDWRLGLLADLSAAATWEGYAASLARTFQKCDGTGGSPALKQKKNAWFCYRYDIPKDSPWYEALYTQCGEMKEQAAEWQQLFAEPWADVARRENTLRAWLGRLWQLGLDFDAEYRAVKRQRQVQDFNDLERDALSLLTAATDADELEPSQIALELRGAFREVLVDEYQDVNRLQDAILRLVTPELPDGTGQARVVVGDIKQSIYGFRQAEPEIFRELVARLAADDAAGRPAHTFRLRENFRSRHEILTAINVLMDGLFTGSLGGEDYAASGALSYGGVYGVDAEPGEQGRVRLHLVLDGAAVAGEPNAGTAQEAEARATTQLRVLDEESAGEDADGDGAAPGTDEKAYHHLAWRLREVFRAGQEPPGYLAARGSGERRPVQWDDLVVLLRSRTGLSILRIILEQAGIPAQVPSSGSYFTQPDVQDALLLLRAVVSPFDDLAMAACLRGPLGRLTSEELLITLHGAAEPPEHRAPVYEKLVSFLRQPDAQLPYTAEYIDAVHDRVSTVLARLAEWRADAVREPVAALCWRVLSEAGLLVSAAAAPYGAQRSANLYELHDRALDFDAQGRFGLARFLEYLSAVQASAHDRGEFPAATGSGAVRIMTVHQAKGLEFPCVFLPYMHRQFNDQDLKQQVLLSYSGGLAGQHLDLAGPLAALAPGRLPELPRRTPSLGFHQVKRLLQRQQAAEELRLLYVAMTRAQERLELFAVLKPSDVAAVQAAQQPPEQERARRPWDWVRRQLAVGIGAALRQEVGAAAGGAGGWLVSTVRAPESEEAGEVARRGWSKVAADTDSPRQLSAEEERLLRAQLEYTYPWPGSTRLPVKATITGLAKHAEPTGVRHEAPVPAAFPRGKPESVLPVFMAAQAASSPLQLGSEVHRLLALLDVTQAQTAEEIAVRWAQAGGSENASHLGENASQYAEKAARMLEELARAFGPWDGARQARELPVTMAVPTEELPGLLDLHEISREACHPGDWVLVQGVLDLLLRWPDRALVLDYKTDHGLDAAGLTERYGAQLRWYARAVRELWPGLPAGSITCALYALNGPELVILENLR